VAPQADHNARARKATCEAREVNREIDRIVEALKDEVIYWCMERFHLQKRNNVSTAHKTASAEIEALWKTSNCGREPRLRTTTLPLASTPTLRIQADATEVILQNVNMLGRDDCPDIPIGTHEHPITGCQSVGIAEVATLVENVAARTEGMDTQSGTR
jgi:hypothetical protein